MPQSGRVFRIFVSSTFSDLQQDPDTLQREVHLKLGAFCRERDCMPALFSDVCF